MIRIFENQQLDLKMQMITDGGQHYFKAKEVALALGYEETKSAIRQHVPKEYRKRLSDILERKYWPPNTPPHTCFISELGLCSLVFGSKMSAAKELGRWILKEVLPMGRRHKEHVDYYVEPTLSNRQTFEIETEFDLHKKVVDYIRRFYPQLLFIAGLGELQDTSNKRIKSWQKGYQKGQPDLIISSYHLEYRGLCLEFKTPKGTGRLSPAQKELLARYENNGYKVLVSNDYDVICRCIDEYCRGVKIFHRYND